MIIRIFNFRLLVVCLFLSLPLYLLSKTEYEAIHKGLSLERFEIDGQILKLYCDFSNVQVEAFDPVTIKVSLFTDFEFKPAESYYVIKKSENSSVSITDYYNYIEFKTDSITLRINKNPLLFEYYHENKLLVKDTVGFFKLWDSRGIRFKIKPDEVIYGGGSRALPINRRGNILMMWNQNIFGYDWGANWLNHCIPFLLSTYNYGLFFDNPSLGYCSVDENKSGIIQYNNDGGQFRYFFIYGKNLSNIQSTYMGLTGEQPLPPRWAMGYLQSKMFFYNSEEVSECVAGMRKSGFPMDAVLHDYIWFGAGLKLGAFKWDTLIFPNYKEMIDSLLNIGIKTILITEPYFRDSSENHNDLKQRGYLTKDTNGNDAKIPIFGLSQGLIDLTKPGASDWFWSKYSSLLKDKVAGFWNDLGEPEVHDPILNHYLGKARDVHNLYCNLWSELQFKGLKTERPNERPFIMSRAASPGIQRFGTVLQCGDAKRSYSQIKSQISILLAAGLGGLAYFHTDIGGFAGEGVSDYELFTRWIQFGIFSPISRVHMAGGVPNEPFRYPDSVQQVIRPYFNLRYQLLPYNYTLAWENTTFGYPLARQMNYFEDRKDWQEIGDQYLWGSSFLVAPVYDSAARSRTITLPPGKWIDFFDNTVYAGDRKVTIDAPLEKLPLFVKSGSIIPMANNMMTTAYFKWDTLTAVYYPDKDVKSYFKMYEDDGNTQDADKINAHQFINFYGESADSLISFRISRSGPGYKGAVTSRQIMLKIPHINFIPDSVTINGKTVGITFSFDMYNSVEQISYINTKDSSLLVKFNWSMDSTEVKLYELTNIIDTVEPVQPNDFISVFPNPFSDKVRIKLNIDHSEMKSMRIVDMFGREVFDFDNLIKINGDGDFYWDGKKSSNTYSTPGVYILIIDTQHGKYVRKIIFNGR